MKSTIRSKIIKQRNDLSSIEVNDFSTQICNNITRHECYINSNRIALYSAFANEVELATLFHSHKQLLLPLIKSNHHMDFKNYTYGDPLLSNKYGILEPTDSKTIQADKIELCLMPLVGFNRKGHRLGMGAGYYDRYFALNNLNKTPTILAGVAYDFQENDTIQCDQWDIPLNYIFTNNEVIKI